MSPKLAQHSNIATGPTDAELLAPFQRLGRFVSESDTRQARADECDYWKKLGERGARWLIRRLDAVGSLPQAWEASDVLAAIGSAALLPILETLSSNPLAEVADILLSAIGGFAFEVKQPDSDELAEALRKMLAHPDDAVRSKAAGATSVLPRAVALHLLNERLTQESELDVREAIQDEAERRG